MVNVVYALFKGIFHLATAIGMYFLMKFIFIRGSEAWMVYASISAWWAALYMGRVASIRWTAVPLIFIGGFVIGCDLLFHAGLTSDPYLPKGNWITGLSHALILSTPVAINEGIWWVERAFARRRIKQATTDSART